MQCGVRGKWLEGSKKGARDDGLKDNGEDNETGLLIHFLGLRKSRFKNKHATWNEKQ